MTSVQVMVDGSRQMKEMKLESDALIYNDQRYHFGQMSYQAPITGTIYGVLLNDKKYVDKMDGPFHGQPYKAPPVHPVLYIKPVNTVNGHLKPIHMPEGENSVQINAALGMVVKKSATRVDVDDALDYVAGYTIVNDVTIPHDDFHRPNIKNKVRDGFCPVGPWIVDKKGIPDPNDVTISVFINGKMEQEIHTGNVVRGSEELLSAVSGFMTLAEGDVLLLGIFDGAPYAKIGDTVRIDVAGIGSLENAIVSETE